LWYYKSLASALAHLYPNIGLDPSQFVKAPSKYWQQPQNRRTFFFEYAKKAGFDPLIADNWYPIARETVLSEKGGPSALDFYKGSLAQALISVFPHVRWEPDRFATLQPGPFGSVVENQRRFFDTYAMKNGFEPLVAENWLAVPRESLHTEKGGRAVLAQYGSLAMALQAVYPSFTIEDSQLGKIARGYWHDVKNRKKFFDAFAHKAGFDPLVAGNWYPIKRDLLLKEQGGESVLDRHYGGSVARALADLYPDVRLDVDKFGTVPRR